MRATNELAIATLNHISQHCALFLVLSAPFLPFLSVCLPAHSLFAAGRLLRAKAKGVITSSVFDCSNGHVQLCSSPPLRLERVLRCIKAGTSPTPCGPVATKAWPLLHPTTSCLLLPPIDFQMSNAHPMYRPPPPAPCAAGSLAPAPFQPFKMNPINPRKRPGAPGIRGTSPPYKHGRPSEPAGAALDVVGLHPTCNTLSVDIKLHTLRLLEATLTYWLTELFPS
jgi:hypothetical protein